VCSAEKLGGLTRHDPRKPPNQSKPRTAWFASFPGLLPQALPQTNQTTPFKGGLVVCWVGAPYLASSSRHLPSPPPPRQTINLDPPRCRESRKHRRVTCAEIEIRAAAAQSPLVVVLRVQRTLFVDRVVSSPPNNRTPFVSLVA